MIAVIFAVTGAWNKDSNTNTHQLYEQVFSAALIFGNIFYIINFVIILKMFVGKIKLVSKCIFANEIEPQTLLVEVMMRTVVCCTIAILSTLTVGIGIIAITISHNMLVVSIHYLVVSIDTAINSSCLMLQWPFTKQIYDNLCGKIQSCNSNVSSDINMTPQTNLQSATVSKDNKDGNAKNNINCNGNNKK